MRSQVIPAASSDAVALAVQIAARASSAATAPSSFATNAQDLAGAEPRESAPLIQRASVHAGAAHAGNVHSASMHGAPAHVGPVEPKLRPDAPLEHAAPTMVPMVAPTAVAPAADPPKAPVDALDPSGLPVLPAHAEPVFRGSDASRAKGAPTDTVSPAEPLSLGQLRTQARVALGAQDWKAAATAASMWLAREGGAEPAIALARSLSALGRREEARAVMVACCKRHPESEEAARLARQLGSLLTAEPARAKAKHAGVRTPH